MKQKEKPSKETLEKWHKDPNNWKLGIFYYNKEDKRILPPKRMAWAGWTVNFANTISVAVFVIVIIINWNNPIPTKMMSACCNPKPESPTPQTDH